MSMFRAQTYQRLLASPEDPSSRSITDEKNWVLLPESLSGFFFGISFVAFFLTARNIHSKVQSTPRKFLAIVGLGIWFLLAILFHAQAAAKLNLNATVDAPQDGVCMGAYISSKLEYRQGVSDVLAAVLVLISAWISGILLVWRAFTLFDRRRWVIYVFGACLIGAIATEIVFLAIWPMDSPDMPGSPWSFIYFIVQLVFSGLIGVLVAYGYISRSKNHKKQPSSGFFDTLANAFVDSGMLLIVALVVALGLCTAENSEVPTYFCLGVLFHIQNIVSCMLISQIVDSTCPPSPVRLPGDHIEV